MAFIRKVYAILAIQLVITASAIFAVQYSESARDYATNSPGLAITCCIVSIATMCMIICCFGRKAPLNYILLLLFTGCEAYMVAGLTAQYDRHTVLMAGTTTALVTVSLTIYAMTTKTDISVFMAAVFVLYLAMMPMMMLSIFCWNIPGMYIFYNVIGLIFYSLYLIIDTIMICKSAEMQKKHGYSMFTYDDYIIGALQLYLDIVMIFIYLLQLFGKD